MFVSLKCSNIKSQAVSTEWKPAVTDHICQAGGGVRELLISPGQGCGGGGGTGVRADPDGPAGGKGPLCPTGGSATVLESLPPP